MLVVVDETIFSLLREGPISSDKARRRLRCGVRALGVLFFTLYDFFFTTVGASLGAVRLMGLSRCGGTTGCDVGGSEVSMSDCRARQLPRRASGDGREVGGGGERIRLMMDFGVGRLMLYDMGEPRSMLAKGRSVCAECAGWVLLPRVHQFPFEYPPPATSRMRREQWRSAGALKNVLDGRNELSKAWRLE